MNHKKKFEHTVNVLLKAYLNDTLQHADCYACAVGNIIAHNLNIKICPILKIWERSGPVWDEVFMTSNGIQSFVKENYRGDSRFQIESSGYTLRQLAKIEFAFETAEYSDDADQYMFNGLMRVIDMLSEIHGIDLETVKETKELFV